MLAPSLYTIRYNPKKKLEDYQRGILKAHFAQAQILQLDWDCSRHNFFKDLLQTLEQCGMPIAIRCNSSVISEVLAVFPRPIEIHIYFSFLDEVKQSEKILKTQKIPYKYVLNGRRSSEFIPIAKYFSDFSSTRIHFSFLTFSAKDPESLRTREVANIIEALEKKFPSISVKPLPGLELFDQNLPEDLDLEPLIKSAEIELSVQNSNIDFSFIIPTHNSKYFLSNVVAHLLRQDFPLQKFEVIIVDDGGTDGTQRHLETFFRSERISGNLRYFYWPKPTAKPYEKPVFRAGLCRNLGANNAKGKYLVFLDSDILVPKNFLADLEYCFTQHDVVQYVRHHILPEKSNSYVNAGMINPKKDLYIEEEAYWGPYFNHPRWQEMPFFWKYTCTYCLAVRREDFFAVGRFRRAFVSYGFEDTDLGYRLHKKGLRFHLSKLVTLHLTPPISAMNSGGSDYKRFLALSKTAKIFFLSNLDIEIYKHFINYMGGERDIIKEFFYFLGKFFKRFSRDPKKSEALIR